MFQFIPPDRGHELIFPNEPVSLFYPAPVVPVLVMSDSSMGAPQYPSAVSSSGLCDYTNLLQYGVG